MSQTETLLTSHWKPYEKVLFRIFFIYALIYSIPLDPGYFKKVFSIEWSKFKFQDIDLISNYSPKLHSNLRGQDLTGFGIALLIAIGIAIIWSVIDRKRENYTILYYWFRVILRYKLAIVIFFYGFIKVFPQQMPYPSLSHLNTNLGDFNAGRLFWLTTGVSFGYEVFTGVFEVVAGFLLFFRKTATLGAILLVVIMVPVVAVNAGYDSGLLTVGANVLILNLILLAPDLVRFYDFLIVKKNVSLIYYYPSLNKKWQKNGRVILKTTIILFFFFVRGFKVHESYAKGGFRLPVTPGLPKISGFYRVKEFKANNHVLPLSDTDKIRWQNVVFEKWNTLSIKISRPVNIYTKDKMKNYEIYNTAGRHYYKYTFDTLKKNLYVKYLQDSARKDFVLHYSQPDSTTIILSGKDDYNNLIEATLIKINKKYPLAEGRYPGLYTP